MRILLAMTLFLSPALVPGQQWRNPSEKYLDEHEKYASATCPIGEDDIQHFVYFSRDREQIRDHAFLSRDKFSGAQIMYAWAQLEKRPSEYDFSIIREDLQYLRARGKKLFVQLQDTTFNPQYKAVPAYLLTDQYDGGAVYQRKENGDPEGWVAKRWNARVRERFALLLNALGRELDGEIEGINLQESAIGVREEDDPSLSPEVYAASLKANMLALKKAFPSSTTMQYANFMRGEWLPWEDKGYLRSIYQYGEEIGVGLGAPDLMPQRKAQLNHALAMMHEHEYSAPLGIAVQDGNYIGLTGSTALKAEHRNIVPLLHGFARDFLKVKYMFWVNQEPYFEQDVLPCFSANR